jgi:DNA repair exonuclease SbcCD nuclease subunit
VRFVATADLQIGMTRHWLDAGGQARFTQARIDALTTIAAIVTEVQAEAVVIAGDLFDRDPVDAADLARTLEAIARVPAQVLVLPGNHDSHHPTSVWQRPNFLDHRPDNLTVLLDDPVQVGGITFVGGPLRTRHPDRPVLHDVLAHLPDDGAPRVVVGHGAVIEVVGDHGTAGAMRQEVLEDAIAQGRAAVIVLGDRHSTLQVDAGGRIWYPGAPEPTDFGDDAGHVLVVDLDGPEPSVEPRRTGTWRFVRESADLSAGEDVEALIARLDALEDKSRTIVKVDPRGMLPVADLERLEAALAGRVARFAALEAELADVELLPADDDTVLDGLPTYAAAVLAALRRERSDAPDDPDVAEEYRLLLRFVRAATR